jgi:hypothetical protein
VTHDVDPAGEPLDQRLAVQELGQDCGLAAAGGSGQPRDAAERVARAILSRPHREGTVEAYCGAASTRR